MLVVDDNYLVGKSLRFHLERERDLTCAGVLSSASALVETVRNLAPDVVLLDIDMPGRSPFDALAEVAVRYPATRVVMLSGHVRSELINRALEAGAWGYLSKNDDMPTIMGGIRRVMAGEVAMSADVLLAIGA